MAMREVIGSAVVAALLSGCSPMAPEDVAGVEQAATIGGGKTRCPDPATDCTVSNGAGVYTDENGAAGFGASQIMITHFINNSWGVTFEARYFDNAQQLWLMLPEQGDVLYADFNGATGLEVNSITESSTVPTWTMTDDSGNTITTDSPADFLSLILHVTVADPNGGPKEYDLGFNGTGVFSANQLNVRKFNMLWRIDGANEPWNQYCTDANGIKDQVVFQQTIAVNPASAVVTRNATTASYVTLSCLLGAPAKVHSWGYPYRPGYAGNVLFDGGLHMKRASYCGDSSFYTKTGTNIAIKDSMGIESDPMSTVEAFWGHDRAICYVPGNERHHSIRFQNALFNGTCANGVSIPVCTGSIVANLPSAWLEDSSSPPAP